MTTPRSRPGRRLAGFTLLETVMAAALGAMVLAGALSVFAMIQRSQRSIFLRAEANNESARVHRTMQRTFSTLLVLEATPPRAANAPATAQPDPEAPPPDEPPPQPRLILGADPRYPDMQVQRLEVVLAAPPIPADPLRDPQFSWASDILAIDAPVQMEMQGQGVRGAFVLTEVPRTTNDLVEPGWALWWIPTEGQRVQVATGLRRLRWTLAKTGENGLEQHETYSATTALDLPAYATLEFEMVSGGYANMMFEIAWSTTRPETLEPTTPGEGGANGIDGQGGGANDAGGDRGATQRPQRPRNRPSNPPSRQPPDRGAGGDDR